MKIKSEVAFFVSQFHQYAKNHFQTSVKYISTNNGTEFLLHSFFAASGIIHQTRCAYTPQQNGVVERKHQHLLNVTRALLFHSHMPVHFWRSTVTASYLINRISTSKLDNKTSFELIFRKLPSNTHPESFGFLYYTSNLLAYIKNFDSGSRRCVFIGYPTRVKGYKLYDLDTKDVVISRDVMFYEHIFPFEKSFPLNLSPSPVFDLVLPVILKIDVSFPHGDSQPTASNSIKVLFTYKHLQIPVMFHILQKLLFLFNLLLKFQITEM